MKTIGEILARSRLEKNLSREQLSAVTKIDIRYIQALEENDFTHLPSATFIKGFVRNLSLALGKDPGEWLALLRRDLSSPTAISNPPRRPRKLSLSALFQSRAALFVIGAIAFIGYLGFQYRAVITPPPLEIVSPTENAVLVSPVSIEGKTVSGTTVVVNDDLKIAPDSSGRFLTKLNLSPGSSEIKIEVVNRFSRSTTKTIPITVVSQ